MMPTAVNLYKRTANLTESAPRMTAAWDGFKGGLLFDVPLHDTDREYATVSTGLVLVQHDILPSGFVDWINKYTDTSLPPVSYPSHAQFAAVNGCPLSQGAHRTYYLLAGDYFLETSGASPFSSSPSQACDNFNVQMDCSGGAETASPADSDPQGFSVDPNTGAIIGVPQRVRESYRMRLRAVDAAAVRTTVADWMFNVEMPPAFALNPSANWNAGTNGTLATKYHVSETHLLPMPDVSTCKLLEHPANGAYDQVVYLLSVNTEGDNHTCTGTDASSSRIISALTDAATGEGAINIKCVGTYAATLVVRDGAGFEVTIRNWTFQVLRRDTDVPEHGPGGRECEHGSAVDGEQMDRQFTCDCAGTRFTGDNCNIGEDTKAATNGPNGRGCWGGLPIDVVPFDQAFTCDCSATRFSGDNCDIEQDTKAATNGPNGRGCGGGLPIDVVPFDQVFTCDCSATQFSGDNCNIGEDAKAATNGPKDQCNATSYAIGAVCAVLVLAAAAIFFIIRHFKAQLERMKQEGRASSVHRNAPQSAQPDKTKIVSAASPAFNSHAGDTFVNTTNC